MALGKRLINTGGEAACLTETTDIFGDSSGKLLYSFDTDASDASGVYSGTPTDIDFGVGGQINTAARFNGTTSDINTNLTWTFGTKLSFSCWFYMAGGESHNQYIIADFNSVGANASFRFAVSVNSSNQLVVGTNDGNSGTFITFGAINSYLNKWTHLAVTVDGTSVKTYLDGSQFGTTGTSSFSLTNGANPFTIGHYAAANTDAHFEGSLDQIRLFSSTLTDSQVSTLAAETACVHTSTTDNNDFPVTNVAYYKLDNSADDSKGTNHGTENNIEYRFGKYNQAAVFNGSSSYINLPNLGTDLSGSNTRTLSAWVNLDANPSVYYAVVSYGAAANLESFGLYISSSGTPRVSYYNLNWDTSTTLTLGNWHHIVGIYKGGNVETSTNTELYINGVKQTITKTGSLTGAINTSNLNYAIGYYRADSTNSFFDGKIDQVRIFSTDISQANVTSLYNEKPETDTSTFKTVLYEGNNSTQYISNVGFQPDFVWVKSRDSASYDHNLYDSVRGVLKRLKSNTNSAEDTNGKLTSFDANGFFLSAGGDANASGQSMVAWCWKGSNADSVLNEVGDIDSQVSNSDKGFSISLYTNNGNASLRVGHGLTVNGVATAPEVCLIKKVSTTGNWQFMTTVIDGSFDFINLNNTNAKSDSSLTAPTTTTFAAESGATGQSMVCYSFASVSGVSKIGTYSGTGSSGNTAITGLGFTPSFFMAKRVDVSGNSWTIHDNRRVESNGNLGHLFADTNTAEGSTGYDVDFVSGGVTINATTSNLNASGTNNYLYMAFK